MAQICQDFVMDAKNDLSIRFEGVYNESTGQIITIGDILDASWAMTPYEEQTTPIAQKTLGNGIAVPADGVVIVSISNSDTDGLYGEYSHELRLKSAGGVLTAARGKVTIRYQIANNPA